MYVECEEAGPSSAHVQLDDIALRFEELVPLPASWIINGEGEGEIGNESLFPIEVSVPYTPHNLPSAATIEDDGCDIPALEESLVPNEPDRHRQSPEPDIPLYATLGGTTSPDKLTPYFASDAPEIDTVSTQRIVYLNRWFIRFLSLLEFLFAASRPTFWTCVFLCLFCFPLHIWRKPQWMTSEASIDKISLCRIHIFLHVLFFFRNCSEPM